MRMGVYAIVHRPTGRVYVGASRDVSRRWTKHRNRLNAGVHVNASLQAVWTQDGADAFGWVMLEAVDILAMLQERERFHLDAARQAGPVFNLRPVGASSERLSAGNVGKHACTPEQRAARSARARGWRPSDAWKQQQSQTHRGVPKAPEHAAKLRAHLNAIRPDNHGSKRSPETRARMAEAARVAWARRKAEAA